ncbi:MAG: exodeoxyribonuclease V subunit gamma, partial [Ignavibacteria bacterium]|nr:exodeoxyribonuclease V subunit gamma [Ignavibacteria bacterium]
MIFTKCNIDKIDLDFLIDQKIKSGSLDEALFIVPTKRKIRYLKRELVSLSPNKTAKGLQIETIGTFASAMLSAAGTETNLLKDEASIILLNQCFTKKRLKYFSQYSNGIPFGTLERIKNVISEYKKHGISAKDILKETEKLTGAEKLKAEDISSVYQLYQEKIEQLPAKEIGDIYAKLNEISLTNFKKGFRDIYSKVNLVLLNGFDEFTIPEIEIINKTADIEGLDLHLLFDYYKYNPSIFSHLDKCYNNFLAKGFKEIKDESTGIHTPFLNSVRSNLFLQSGKKVKDFKQSLTKIAASSREKEIELIAKEIKSLILNKKAEPSSICVAFNLIDKYSPIIRDKFRLYGIPLNLTDRFSLATSQPVIAIINLLEILGNDFYYRNIFRAFDSFFVEKKGIDLSNLLKASVELRIISGYQNWKDRLNDAILAQLIEDRSLNNFSKHQASHQKAIEDIDSIYYMLKPFRKPMNFTEFYNQLINLVFKIDYPFKIIEGKNENVEKDVKALTTLLNNLEELSLLFDLEHGGDKKFPLKFFINQLKTFALFSRYNVKEIPGYGVQVTTLNEIRGLNFDYLFIGGLNDGDLPTRYSPEIFFSGSFAKEEQKHQTEERYHFYQALCTWKKHLFLTQPLFDDKKELVESNLFTEFNNLFELRIKDEANYEKLILSKEDLLKYIGETSLDKIDELELPCEIDVDLKRIKESIIIYKQRSEDPFGDSPYTGNIKTGLTTELVKKLDELSERQFSSTQLETYAKCPYKYFAERVLNLSTLEEPSEELEALELGSLLHVILYEFYTSLKEKDIELLRCSDAEFKEAKKLLFAIAEKRFNEIHTGSISSFYEREKLFGFKNRKENSLLYKFLLEERNSDDGFIPEYFELTFGNISDENLPASEFKIDDVNLRGKIDRVDINENRDAIKIVDYKLGGTKPSVSDLQRGLSLQLPLYLFAAKELINAQQQKDLQPFGTEIYSLKYSSKDFGKKLVGGRNVRTKETDEFYEKRKNESEQMIETCLEWVKKYVSAISNGVFHLSDLEDREKKVCNYCNFKAIC